MVLFTILWKIVEAIFPLDICEPKCKQMCMLIEKNTLLIIFVRWAVLISQRSVILNITIMNFYNEHIHHKTHHLNFGAVESLKLTEKMKRRKGFPLFAGCISSPSLFLCAFCLGVGVGVGCCVVRDCSISDNLICFC